MTLRWTDLLIVCLLAWFTVGCAADAFKSTSDGSSGAKSSRSSRDAADDADPWNEVGREARGDRPIQKENDPLRDLFVSPKAQEIERSLGVQ